MSYQGRYQGQKSYSGKKKWWPGKGKPAAAIEPHKRISTPSDLQLAIFSNVAESSSNTFIRARAGTGKTSSLSEALFRLAESGHKLPKCGFFAFNNRIANEAKGKLTPLASWVDVMTCHSYGLRALKAYDSHVEVDDEKNIETCKMEAIVRALVGGADEQTELRYMLRKAASLAKCYLAETVAEVADVCDLHGVEIGDDSTAFYENVVKALEMSVEQRQRVNFDDMIYLAVKLGVRVPQYSLVVIDEAQDLSKARLELMLRGVSPGGRIISVGDDMQSIYGFAGCMSDSVDNIIKRTDATVLPLNITYRCGKHIVELAKQIVPDYIAAPTAPDGEVVECSESYCMSHAEHGSYVLSRTNAPLVGACLSFIKAGKRACVQGRDLGRSLVWMIRRSEAESVDGFLTWLSAWEQTECERLTEKGKDCSLINDKAEVLRIFCEGERDLAGVKTRIGKVFDDDNDDTRIVCSTTHKAKGTEKDTVWVLTDTFKAAKGGEEARIWSVAITRAKTHLYLVSKHFSGSDPVVEEVVEDG